MNIGLRYAHSFFLHLLLLTIGGQKWELTAVYASPNAIKRLVFREKVEELKVENTQILMGDFNCVLHDEE